MANLRTRLVDSRKARISASRTPQARLSNRGGAGGRRPVMHRSGQTRCHQRARQLQALRQYRFFLRRGLANWAKLGDGPRRWQVVSIAEQNMRGERWMIGIAAGAASLWRR